MNNIIKELAEQAGAIETTHITNIPRALSLNGEEIEKFAVLIINDVLKIAVNSLPAVIYLDVFNVIIEAVKERYKVTDA